MTGRLLESIDPQATHEAAVAQREPPEDEEPSAEQLDAVERERMAEALRPFSQPGLRRAIVEIAQSLYQIIDEAAIDVLTRLWGIAKLRSRAHARSWTTSSGSSRRTRMTSRRSGSCTAALTARGCGIVT